MEDILFYNNYVSAGDIITITVTAVIFLLLHSTYAVKKLNYNVFLSGTISLCIAALTSIWYHHMILEITVQNVLVIYLTRAISYSGLMLTYVSFLVYIRNLVDMKKIYRKIFNVSIYGLTSAAILSEFIGPFVKRGFYIDENLMVHQNYYTDVFRYMYSYYTISMAVLLIAYRKKFVGKMLRCIALTMLVSFFLMAYQDMQMQTTYISISFVFPILAFLFLYHHNSYEIETGMLDHHAFDAYIYDMHKKQFSMIFLSFPELTREKLEKMSSELFNLSDRYMMYACTFRLRDNKMVMVYQKEKNKNVKQVLQDLFANFIHLYQKLKMDFHIVLIDSTQEFLYGEDYLALCEYVEQKSPMNTVYSCKEEDVKNFIHSKYILQELQDIHEKSDLNDERVKVFCQPVFHTKKNQFTTAEALMRLELKELGMVYPDQFIDMAEKHGYIHILSRIILNKTCQYIKHLENEGYHIERISVNFAIQELHMDDFSKDVMMIIGKNGIPFEKIAVELTESRNEKDFKSVKRVMEELQQVGIKFYLDDFGTGYSNFERIIGLPIDIIKFDRSLTIMAGKNETSKFMVGSFSEIFKKADYQILFEGVEDEKDEQQCIGMEAMYLQGYKYSKPIPIQQLENFLVKAS